MTPRGVLHLPARLLLPGRRPRRAAVLGARRARDHDLGPVELRGGHARRLLPAQHPPPAAAGRRLQGARPRPLAPPQRPLLSSRSALASTPAPLAFGSRPVALHRANLHQVHQGQGARSRSRRVELHGLSASRWNRALCIAHLTSGHQRPGRQRAFFSLPCPQVRDPGLIPQEAAVSRRPLYRGLMVGSDKRKCAHGAR